MQTAVNRLIEQTFLHYEHIYILINDTGEALRGELLSIPPSLYGKQSAGTGCCFIGSLNFQKKEVLLLYSYIHSYLETRIPAARTGKDSFWIDPDICHIRIAAV